MIHRPTRRGFLAGSAWAASCVACAPAGAAALRCEGLAEPPAIALDPAAQERHTILLLAAMALAQAGWSVAPDPALRAEYARLAPMLTPIDRGGHNVGGLLVQGDEIVSFAANRSIALQSTMEHAEARAVAHAFHLAGPELAATGKRFGYSTLLRGATLYATLEPCAQCAGIAALANLAGLVFAQRDPGQRCIANVLYNLHQGRGGVPLPLAASFLPLAAELDAAATAFAAARQGQGPAGATAFLETPAAYLIFSRAAATFLAWQPTFPANENVLASARRFHADWADRLDGGVAPA